MLQKRVLSKSPILCVNRHLHLPKNDTGSAISGSKEVTPIKSNNISNNDDEDEDSVDIMASTIPQNNDKMVKIPHI